MHAFDRQTKGRTDGRTDRRTPFSSLVRAGIPRSAENHVKSRLTPTYYSAVENLDKWIYDGVRSSIGSSEVAVSVHA